MVIQPWCLQPHLPGSPSLLYKLFRDRTSFSLFAILVYFAGITVMDLAYRRDHGSSAACTYLFKFSQLLNRNMVFVPLSSPSLLQVP